MIDEFAIFERGGTVLWRRSFVTLKGDPLAVLVRSVLLEDRLSLPELSFDCYTLRWLLNNQTGLIFVVIFQRQLPPAYADPLLSSVRKEFVKNHVKIIPTKAAPVVVDTAANYDAFDTVFDQLLHAAESRSISTAKKRPPIVEKPAVKEIPAATSSENEDDSSATTVLPESEALSPEDVRRNREAFFKNRTRRKHASSTRSKSKPVESTEPVSKGKKMRPSNKSRQPDMSTLDFSQGTPEDAERAEVERFKNQFINAAPSGYDMIENSDEESEEEDAGAIGGMFNYFKGLAGMRNLTRADVEPVMTKFRDGLIGKNVAQDIADKLIESVITSLEGKKMESFTSITTTVRNALDDALTRILTSRQTTDILAEIEAKKTTGVPFVITYCGVNGVGKSTSLAKTCYYLLNHGHKVMIAACDTFRAGAVEQLRTHVKCLGKGVELFDRGYGKDAAAVAADAIRKAKELKYDVVLVDTAGRMQDNEPLMRALAKLVEFNKPDRLFFVGEALVGNDAVDQLTKFNQALIDHQHTAKPRLIDGIVLTKFDTIDDKVGAAVSMVYTTGQPIVFVGVGQTYMDLRKVNTKALVKALIR